MLIRITNDPILAPSRPLPPHQLPIRHPVRLIGVGAFALLQVLDVRLEVPLELRARSRGYDGIGVIFIGEMAGGRVVHPCHEHPVVTTPLVTDPTGGLAATTWTSVLAPGWDAFER